MTRKMTSAIFGGFFVGLLVMAMPSSARSEVLTDARVAYVPSAQEFSAQSRTELRRAPRRVPVYRGSSYPGPNSVRVCNAYYEQEYRPSGTVIVPRMRCRWRG